MKFFFLVSAELLGLRRNCEKASHHNFKSKQQAVQGDKRCACFASIGPRSLRIGVSQPNTTTLKLTTTRSILNRWKAAATGSTKFTHFKSSGKITPIVIFQHTAPSSCVRIKQTKTAHSARGDLNGERSKSAFDDLRHRPVGMYPNEPLSRWKSKPIGAVKSALSHVDRDKLISQPLDFELL